MCVVEKLSCYTTSLSTSAFKRRWPRAFWSPAPQTRKDQITTAEFPELATAEYSSDSFGRETKTVWGKSPSADTSGPSSLPASPQPSTSGIVLSRGAIEFPDVELRDTSTHLLYPHFCSSGPSSLPPTLPAGDSISKPPSSAILRPFSAEGLEEDPVFTIMGRLRTGIGESECLFLPISFIGSASCVGISHAFQL